MSDNPLHFTLKSGRVFILKQPFTALELAIVNTAEGMAILEELADEFEQTAKKVIDSESAEGVAMLKKHGIQP